MASGQSPYSVPLKKRLRHSTTESTTELISPVRRATVDVSDAFSRLEVTPRRKSCHRRRLNFERAPQQDNVEPGQNAEPADSEQQISACERKKMPNWSIQELRGLLLFMMLHTDGSHWVGHKDPRFWSAAGEFIHQQTSLPYRSGDSTVILPVSFLLCCLLHLASACRSKMINLATKFRSPAEAERFYAPERAVVSSSVHESPLLPSEVLKGYKELMKDLPDEKRMSVIVELFSWLDEYQHGEALFPPDFLEFVFQAVQQLQNSGRANVLYLLARGLATMRPDGSDSLIPVTRMPMGLLEYTICFFNANHVQQVQYIIMQWRIQGLEGGVSCACAQ